MAVHGRRQSEGGVILPSASGTGSARAIPLAAAASSPNFSLSQLSLSQSNPAIELPQRPRLGPFWVTASRYQTLKASMDNVLFEALGFAIGPPTSSDGSPTAAVSEVTGSPENAKQSLLTITGDGPGHIVGRPDPTPLMEEHEGRTVIRGGTLPTLVNQLSVQGVSADPDFMSHFLRTYRYFADARDVARLLILRYLEVGWQLEAGSVDGGLNSTGDIQSNIPEKVEKTEKPEKKGWYSSSKTKGNSSASSSTTASANSLSGSVSAAAKEIDGFLQLRVLNVFKKWIEAHPEDFSRNPALHELGKLFLDRHVKLDPRRILYVASILKNLEEKAPSSSINPAVSITTASGHSKAFSTGTTYNPSKLHITIIREHFINTSNPKRNKCDCAEKRNDKPIERDSEESSASGFAGGLTLRRGSRTPAAPASISLSLALSMLEPPTINMSDLDPTVIAQQLTLMEHNQFRRIKIEEFYCQAWNQQPSSGGKTQIRSRLGSLIGWFNRVAYAVASEVVLAYKIKDRVSVLKRFIFIAHLCLKWNNFNTVFEIVAGLNLGAITRLKKTWKALPSKYWDVWNTLNRTVSDEGSYRVYRQAITALKDRKPDVPILPYLGVNLKDLTFAEDGNPTYIAPADVAVALRVPQNAADKYINFTKFRLISKLLENIMASQKGQYDFKADDKVQGFLKDDWVALETADLYEHSRQCEPRVPTST
ncbi:RasGEF [Phlyctochytrium bullatum]|nr:RasGEF [Phlyctochytrium bullatum]